ncbi:hypothetical protein [Hymenobacter convexus]|uniref:hypothetical protein n=1 Tax=Hymenobacter sp. CA1UV-4 TaxID=3063782 RepID=UPI0027127D1F|nr:hypothetical protein [Hymenobacter sp. CA1UV-4]MDO7851377.1 hypothetical protein [Hymenobacter sp. CA1UV-4]
MNPLTDFAPEPYLPWLRTDPAMQHPTGFISTEVLTLSAYVPMSRHFPAGTQVAAKRVFCPEDLTEGVYWFQRFHPADGLCFKQEHTECAFGRFAGLMPTSNERAQARRLKQGYAHLELSADVDCTDSKRAYFLREDGTQTVHMDFNDPNFKLWRFTHYVSLPAPALATLGDAATGYSPEQTRWLREEQAIWQDLGAEFTAQVLGGFPLPELRAVLTYQQHDDFNCVLNTLPRLMPSQAKKRRAGSVVALGWRSTNWLGQPVTLTEYLKVEDAALLLDQLQSITDLHRAEARVQESRAAGQAAATAIRAARDAARAVQVPPTSAQALSFAPSAGLSALAA